MAGFVIPVVDSLENAMIQTSRGRCSYLLLLMSLLPTFIPTNVKPHQGEANTGSQPPSSKKPRLLDFCSIDDEGVETDANDVWNCKQFLISHA